MNVCAATPPAVYNPPSHITCALPAGHPGNHDDADGHVWAHQPTPASRLDDILALAFAGDLRGYQLTSILLSEYADAVPAAVAHTVGSAFTDWQDLRDALADAAADLVKTAERVQRRLAAREHVNGLGELQSSGPRFDALCARHQDAVTACQRARWTVTQLVTPDPVA